MKHAISDSHIEVHVTYNCRYIFVLFHKNHVHEFKKFKFFFFFFLVFGISVFASSGDGYQLQPLLCW